MNSAGNYTVCDSDATSANVAEKILNHRSWRKSKCKHRGAEDAEANAEKKIIEFGNAILLCIICISLRLSLRPQRLCVCIWFFRARSSAADSPGSSFLLCAHFPRRRIAWLNYLVVRGIVNSFIIKAYQQDRCRLSVVFAGEAWLCACRPRSLCDSGQPMMRLSIMWPGGR